uniref:Uncharacterized protein n=1 Tax=Arundo donax TaxID=35708 RepID=A0A0A9D201_ARUDO
MKQQFVKQPTVWPEHWKTSLWSQVKGDTINMLPDRIGRLMRYSNHNSMVTRPHVYRQVIPMTGIIEHYEFLPMVAAKGMIFQTNALLLRRAYSKFRPVFGEGESFYRSFIFSYLEQVLDRPDTHEEHRLLAAIKGVARQHARFGWTSDFSSCRKAFKILIKKVMRWKRHSRWKRIPSTNSYCKQKLLEFFSGYGTMEDIFGFLRLVAAIWICSPSEEYEPRVFELREDYTLKYWCFREVIEQRVFMDHVQITTVVTALGVPPTAYPIVFVSGAKESISVAVADNFWSVKVMDFVRRWAEAVEIKKYKVWGRVVRRKHSSRWIAVMIVLLCIASFPTPTDSFQVHKNVDQAADALGAVNNIVELREIFQRKVGAAVARPGVGSGACRCFVAVIVLGACLLSLASKLIGEADEPTPAGVDHHLMQQEQQFPKIQEVDPTAAMVISVVFCIVLVVLICAVVRR